MLRFVSKMSSIPPCALLWNSVRTKYSPKVEDHYFNPRNVGTMDKTDSNVGSALRGAPECGDVAQLFLRVNEETTEIEEVRFKAFGCASAIASTSYVSELLRGKTLGDALAVSNKQIASELSLPPVKLHCSLLAEETIHAAVENYLSKNPKHKHKVQHGTPSA